MDCLLFCLRQAGRSSRLWDQKCLPFFEQGKIISFLYLALLLLRSIVVVFLSSQRNSFMGVKISCPQAIMKWNQRRRTSAERARSPDELAEGQRGPVTRCGHARVVPVVLSMSPLGNEGECPTTLVRQQQQRTQASPTLMTPETHSAAAVAPAPAPAPSAGSGEVLVAPAALRAHAVSAVRIDYDRSASWEQALPVATAVGPPLLAERLNRLRHY